jgi:hypothetical protein
MDFPHINPYVGCSTGDSESGLLTASGLWTFAKPCCKAGCGSTLIKERTNTASNQSIMKVLCVVTLSQ